MNTTTATSATVAPPPATTQPKTATTTAMTATQPQPKPATTAAATMKPTVTPTATASQQAATGAPKALVPAVTKPAPAQPKQQATAPADTTAPALASGGFLVQVASYPSEADATAAFASLKQKNGALLSGYSANIKKVDLGAKGTWYRLRVGPFADKAGAAAAAARLGGGSFPTKP